MIDVPATDRHSPADMEKMIAAAEDYAAATRIDCMVIGPDGTPVHSVHSSPAVRRLCMLASETISEDAHHPGVGSCAESHLYGACQARRFGGEYIHFCRMGLACWTSPIMKNGVMVFALTGGPVHMREPDDILAVESSILSAMPNHEKISALFGEVPVVSPSRVVSLSRVLMRVARDLSDESYGIVDDAARSNEIQSDIWDRMHALKLFDSAENPRNYPFETEEELLRMIECGNRDSAQRLLNSLLGSIFFSKGGDMPTLKARIVELTVLLSRAAIRGGADSSRIFGMNFDYLDQIAGFQTVDELAAWLSGAMGRFTEQVFFLQNARNTDVIFKAVNYIRRQYRRRLTLEEVAGYVHLSPMYFSRLFKEDVGVNFVTHVNRVRVEAACSLLLTSTMPIAELSLQTGFDSQSYFSKVFRKVTGVTPGSYRKTRGQLSRIKTTGGAKHGTDEHNFSHTAGRAGQGSQSTRTAGH